jgi:hypothetical protein
MFGAAESLQATFDLLTSRHRSAAILYQNHQALKMTKHQAGFKRGNNVTVDLPDQIEHL